MASAMDGDYPQVVSPLSKGPITQFVLEGKQVNAKSPEVPDTIRSMYNGGRREMEESSEFTINPDPVPYQPSNFLSHRFDRLDYPESSTMSSTVLKKVPVSRRHLESFGGTDIGSGSSRGLILRTDRYQWDLASAFAGLNQRERLQAELEYMERLRGIKRRKEVLPHRAQLDLLMGGKKVDFSERFDIQREIQKLRSLILPQNARDLFHGRGFTLPDYHNSVKPRHILPLDIDNDDLQDETVEEGSTQPTSLRRSKTNVIPQKPAGRSLTALPNKKADNKRPAATAPTVKIPISHPERSDLYAAPKPTPIIESGRPEVDEEEVELNMVNDDDTHMPRHGARSRATPMQAPTPNPLKGSELPAALSVEEQMKLKKTFQKLDTDKDGHIKFTQLRTQLPKQFSISQERFIKQVYDITSSSTFFGVDEFMSMSYLTNCVTSLTGDALDAYNKLDYTSLYDTIVQYVHLFQSVDRTHRGKMSLGDLKTILGQAGANLQHWGDIVDTIAPSESGTISKIEFLAHLPYFETLKGK